MTNICRRTVTVVRQNVEHDSCAAGTIALVKEFFVVASLGCAKSLLNSTVDIVLRDIVCLRLGKSKFQTHIACRVAAAHTDGNRDLTPNLRSNLAANGIISALLAFDISPFGMS